MQSCACHLKLKRFGTHLIRPLNACFDLNAGTMIRDRPPQCDGNVKNLISFKDDRPINDDLNVVSVKWGFGQDTSKYNNTEYSIPDDGIIKLKVRKYNLDNMLL